MSTNGSKSDLDESPTDNNEGNQDNNDDEEGNINFSNLSI